MFVFDAGHESSRSLVDRYLLNTLIATSMLLQQDHSPGQLCERLLLAIEMEADVLAQVDSLEKLFVRETPHSALLSRF